MRQKKPLNDLNFSIKDQRIHQNTSESIHTLQLHIMKQTILLLLGVFHLVTSRPESYSFAYDTNTGGFHSQSGSPKGASAKYGFNTPEGNLNVQFSGGGGNGGPFPSYAAPSANGGSYTLNLNPDGSYSYSYDAKDQKKSESRNKDGEVAGQFSYTDPDGKKKAIEYTAGVGGFLPKGDHIPKPEDVPSGLPSSYSANGGSGSLELNLQPGGDYSYSYNLKDQSKSESGKGGKVKGQFSFVDPDGNNRAIKYTADEEGFKPEGDHIPKPVEPLSPPSAGVYTAPAPPPPEPSDGAIGSYSYSYDAMEHAKSESASGGSVSGQYSIPGSQQSSYTAGKKGFLPIHKITIKLG